MLTLRFKLKAMRRGQTIRVHATDPAAPVDLPAWCRLTGDTLLHYDRGRALYYIQRTGA